jgi:GT2 family glycosyltransferase
MRWPGIAYCYTGTPLELRDLGQALWRPALASIGAGFAIASVGTVAAGPPTPFRLLGEAVGFAVLYVLAWRALPGGRTAIANVARLARDLLPGDRAGAQAAARDVAATRPQAPAPTPAAEAPDGLPMVSVIVPVYDDAARLGSCLRALAAQTYPRERLEILVVDNASRDESAAVAADFRLARVLTEPTPGSYAARNAGLAAATGEVVAFTDSDCIPDPEWLARGVAALRRVERCGLVGGAVHVLLRSAATPTAAELYDYVFQFDQQRFVAHGRFACTANVFIWSRVIAEVGPFDGTVKSVGDRDLGNRIAAAGYRLVYAADAVVAHPARATVGALLRKRRRVAGGHHDRSRKLPHPWLRFVAGLTYHLVRNPIVGGARIWDRTRERPVGERLRIVMVHLLCCGTEALERIRLQLGGTSRRA